MNTVLILVTSTYPYGTGESFIHNEISFMDVFDNVLIIPMDNITGEKSRLINTPQITILAKKDTRNLKKINIMKAIGIRSGLECLKEISSINAVKRFSYILHFESEVNIFKRMLLENIENFIKEHKPQKIVIYSYWLYKQALLAIDLRKRLASFCQNIKCISRAHGFDIYAERNATGFLPYREYLLSHLDHVYCCSNQGTEYLRKRYPRFLQKISTSYLGVNDGWNGHFPEKKEIFHIVTCAKVTAVKRLNLWVKALATIRDIPLRWTHIGDGEDFENIKKLTQDILSDNVQATFIGYMSNKEVIPFYNNNEVNLFVNTSSSEGLPVSIMEAFSCGIPAIAPKVGGIPEIIENNVNGLLFDVDASSEEIAKCIRVFTSLSEDKYKTFCQTARNRYEESFNSIKNYKSFFKEIMQ